MVKPTILDASGHPLAKGMRVNLHGRVGTVGEAALQDDGSYAIHFLPDPMPCWVSPETNRAPDLKAVLTPDPEAKP